MKKISLFIFILLSLIFFSNNSYANLPINDLMYYYTFGDGYNATCFYDTHSKNCSMILTPNSNFNAYSVVSGKKGSAIKFLNVINTLYGVSHIGLLVNKFPLDNSDFTVNFWIKLDGTYSVYVNICQYSVNTGCQNLNLRFIMSSTTFNFSELRLYVDYNSYSSGSIAVNRCSKFDWCMFTIRYNNTNNRFSLFINAEYIGEIGYSHNIPYNLAYLNFQLSDASVDEMSIWDKMLSSSEISTLYNNGDGLDYNQTLRGTAYTYPKYFNYCINYSVLCSEYQTNISKCLDTERTICLDGCVDYREYWYPYEAFGGNYNGYCNSTRILKYNITTIFYDVCLGTQLCKKLFVNYENDTVSCPITYNGSVNLEYCITGCNDLSAYYNSINSYPTDYNYSGKCALCSNECLVENSTRCLNNIQQICLKHYNGCNYWRNNLICAYGCFNGVCRDKIQNITSPSTPLKNDTIIAQLLPIETDNFTYAVIVIIISAIIILSVGVISKSSLGIVLSLVVASFVVLLELIIFAWKNYIPKWIVVLIIVIVAFIFVINMRNIFTRDD